MQHLSRPRIAVTFPIVIKKRRKDNTVLHATPHTLYLKRPNRHVPLEVISRHSGCFHSTHQKKYVTHRVRLQQKESTAVRNVSTKFVCKITQRVVISLEPKPNRRRRLHRFHSEETLAIEETEKPNKRKFSVARKTHSHAHRNLTENRSENYAHIINNYNRYK